MAVWTEPTELIGEFPASPFPPATGLWGVDITGEDDGLKEIGSLITIVVVKGDESIECKYG